MEEKTLTDVDDSIEVNSQTVTVLVEFEKSRFEIRSSSRSICKDVEKKLSLWVEKPVVCVTDEQYTRREKNVYLLQRWSDKWQSFVNLSSTEKLMPNDKLAVEPKPVNSPKKVNKVTPL